MGTAKLYLVQSASLAGGYIDVFFTHPDNPSMEEFRKCILTPLDGEDVVEAPRAREAKRRLKAAGYKEEQYNPFVSVCVFDSHEGQFDEAELGEYLSR